MAFLYPYPYNVTWHCSHHEMEPISPSWPSNVGLALANRRGWSDGVPVPSLDLKGVCTPISVWHLCDLPENKLACWRLGHSPVAPFESLDVWKNTSAQPPHQPTTEAWINVPNNICWDQSSTTTQPTYIHVRNDKWLWC